jgi:hypothetical protein
MGHRNSFDQHVLVYDGDCAFCTLWVNRLKRWLPVFPKIQTSQTLALEDYALSQDDVEKYAWYITPTHQYAGHVLACGFWGISLPLRRCRGWPPVFMPSPPAFATNFPVEQPRVTPRRTSTKP